MSNLRDRMLHDMQLHGYAERTQEAYLRTVRQLQQFYELSPEAISEDQLRDYFIHRQQVSHWSPATMRIAYAGIKFFFTYTLKRKWGTLELIRAQSERKLPTVLTIDEVSSILQAVTTAHNKAYLTVVYCCGLRLQEALQLQVGDIDIVPAGGLSSDRKRWLRSRPDFFIRVEPLSIVYRAKFRDAMKEAGLSHKIDSAVWRKPWVVNSQAVGDGRSSLKYLTPYVFRVAISNSRIVDFSAGRVTFRYRKSGSNRWRTMSVDAMEFIRRFLQHVLPVGMMKIRHYGFLNANAKLPLQKIRELICVLYEMVTGLVVPVTKPAERRRIMTCRQCGHRLRWIRFSRCFVGPG